MSTVMQFIINLWSVYDFKESDINDFAHQQLIAENRQGLKIMSTFLILIILIAMLLFKQLGQIDNSYSINYFWVLALAAHINISARVVSDIKTLHALGVTLLVISATAYVFIAHQAGEFSPLLMANIILLFMIIPTIPWGLREATAVVLAIYFLLTLSTLGVNSRFDNETFKVLQFFLLAAGTSSLLLVTRSSQVRQKELVSHFNLQKAHAELYTLSNIDPLTSAWNRRYTETAIDNLISAFSKKHDQFQFVIFDLDDFKILNDRFGHDFGDRVLVITSEIIIKSLDREGYLIRIGGDEFIILMVGNDTDQFMQNICRQICSQIKAVEEQALFGCSWGSVSLPIKQVENIESVYQQADQALYLHKQSHRDSRARLSQ